jgi:hypothetical protein
MCQILTEVEMTGNESSQDYDPHCTLYRNWLLIIDSADNMHEQDFTQYIQICQYGSILVTSTRREAAEVFAMESQEIGSLDPHIGQQLLLTRIHNTRSLASRFPRFSHREKV